MLAALLDASLNGDKAKVLELLHHVDINASDSNGRTAIHFAAVNGHLDIVSELCARGANVNQETNYGRTPMHAAAIQGRRDTVELLCKFGAKVSIQDRINDMTPLHWAAWEGHTGTVQVLLRHGAGLFERNGQGKTALELATSVGYVAIIELLKPHMFVFPAMLVFRQAQEVRRLGVNSALRRFPRELCRMVMHMLC